MISARVGAGFAVGALLVGASVAGCHSGSTDSKAKAELSTPQGKQAQAIVTACVGKSAGSIKAIETCLAPGGAAAKARFKSCAAHAVIYLTDKGKFENALDLCVVKDR